MSKTRIVFMAISQEKSLLQILQNAPFQTREKHSKMSLLIKTKLILGYNIQI